jgi:hypothetical protein
MRDIEKRLRRLEEQHGTGICDCQKTEIVHRVLDEGDPIPACEKCGEPLCCLIISEVIVHDREEAEAALRALRESQSP